ncbi:DUF3280 domain-containing protein [Jiella sp. MQZ9-1]|uniref:DUF2380 domain-containing protein n=1 Tax=Jiella flava TaxID=2816857 RepID=A0A939FZL7_9HYPH|nr:DUF2380 domain-containing protein [Jiella flava]MBO0662294.1 DUF2380 domain-containing protein [Jiella flava]MCD2470875.1 DUF3280 domain-containing protein [Jiella flava]
MQKAIKLIALIVAVSCGAVVSTVAGIGAQTDPVATPAIAVAAFDYTDSSGEVRDQSTQHAARIKAFRADIEAGLTAGPRYVPVSLGCRRKDACSLATLHPEPLLAAARAAGADYLVFGGVKKMSTLVGWGRVGVLDVAANRLVFDRVISFRGDSDAAFEKAADFVVKDIRRALAAPIGKAGDMSEGGMRGVR